MPQGRELNDNQNMHTVPRFSDPQTKCKGPKRNIILRRQYQFKYQININPYFLKLSPFLSNNLGALNISRIRNKIPASIKITH